MHKDEIKELVHLKHKNLKLNSSNTNNRYNYLKYEDQVNEITVLFFLSDKDKCKRIRLMSDYSNINEMISEMNAQYTKVKKNNWKYSQDKNNYLVNLDEGDWFFTITIKNKTEKNTKAEK
jgi:Fe2+ transport system protein B